MSDLLAARLTMAFSLGFHIIFAAIGMTMPFFMAAAHYKYLKSKDPKYLQLTKMWMKGVAIFFAVGAVSGTVLSFELGLLWPGFMKYAGPIIGMPFSWEGTAFFIEAIALGLFLYGWDRVHPWLHWWTGVLVGVSGFASGIFVVAANGWMNTPQGFTIENGEIIDVSPLEAMFNPAWLHQTLHMQVAALQAVGLAVAGIHAFIILRGSQNSIHRSALNIAMVCAAVTSLMQPFVGHFAAQEVARLQPLKLAAMEGHFKTEERASLFIGGLPNLETEEMDWGLELPGLLSFLAYNDFDAEVKGLDQFDREDWPPVVITHLAFQVMVGLGSLFVLVALGFFYFFKKGDYPRWFLKGLVLITPLGFVAIEAGWIVTEVGRQPWIIYNFMRTSDAVTPVAGMVYHFYLFLFIYILLAVLCGWLLKRLVYYYD